MYRYWPSYMHISTHLFFTLKNAWVVCSAAPAVVFKIDEVLTFSCKLLSQQQKLNILSLFDTVLPKGINQAAGTQGQIQGMDFHRIIKFTDAPFFFFFFFLLCSKSIIFLLFFNLSFMLGFLRMSGNLLMSLHFGEEEIKLLIGSCSVLIWLAESSTGSCVAD